MTKIDLQNLSLEVKVFYEVSVWKKEKKKRTCICEGRVGRHISNTPSFESSYIWIKNKDTLSFKCETESCHLLQNNHC